MPAITEISSGDPASLCLRNARAKAQAISRGEPGWVALGADTVVALDGEVYGKPESWEHARDMLSRLSGRVHEVFTAVCAVRDGAERLLLETSRVKFRTANLEAIERYIARIQPLDKAGGYAAQDDQGEMIECIEGSASNVAGLPLERTIRLLSSLGIFPRGWPAVGQQAVPGP